MGLDLATAFQGWYILGYLLNFTAAGLGLVAIKAHPPGSGGRRILLHLWATRCWLRRTTPSCFTGFASHWRVIPYGGSTSCPG